VTEAEQASKEVRQVVSQLSELKHSRITQRVALKLISLLYEAEQRDGRQPEKHGPDVQFAASVPAYYRSLSPHHHIIATIQVLNNEMKQKGLYDIPAERVSFTDLNRLTAIYESTVRDLGFGRHPQFGTPQR